MRRQVTASAAGSIQPTASTFARSAFAAAFACVAACLLFWVAAVPAQAATSYSYQGESGVGTLGDVPTDAAVDDTTGYLLVADSSNDRVVVFGSTQPGASVVTTFGAGELSDPYGIAVDPSGDVYVADAGNDRIVRYTSDGAPTPTYTLDGTYTSPAKGTGAEEVGNFASTLAIDPASGDLLVADKGNLRVERFDSTGAFVDSFDGSDSDAGAFTSLLDIATGPDSAIYLIANGTVEPEFGYVESSVVDKFAADGTFDETLAPGELGNARALGFDAHLGNVLVTNGGSFFEGRNIALRAVHDGSLIGSYEIPTPEEASLAMAVAVPSTPGAPLSILTARTVPVSTGKASLLSVKGVAVDVTFSAPTAITGSGAHLSGTVDPHGESGSAHFEYRRVGASDWISGSDQAVSGEGPQPVEEDLTGLLANSSYEARLSANVSGVSETSAPQQFKTEIVAPTATTGEATEIDGSSATLVGYVNPNGTATTFYFEYGSTEAYGSKIPLTPAPAGAGQGALQLTRTISGLQAGATYHFRIVAENSGGVTQGADRTFVAEGPAPENRFFEQVTPVNHEGMTVEAALGPFTPSKATAFSYFVRPVGGDAKGAPYDSRLLSVRGADDWGAPIFTDPPVHYHDSALYKTTLAVSNDATKVLYVTNEQLAPGALEGEQAANIYVEDVRDGSIELVVATQGLQNWAQFGAALENFVTAADDFSWIIFGSPTSLLDGVPAQAYYKWTPGNLELISRLPGGGIPSASLFRPQSGGVSPRLVSDDGSRMLFALEGGGTYLWIGDETVPVSVSELDDELKSVLPLAIDQSGRYAFFATETRMTADSPSAVRTSQSFLYRYDSETGDILYLGEQLAYVTGNALQSAVVSPDGQTVLISARGQLDEGARELLVWHEGVTTSLGLEGSIFDSPEWVNYDASSRYVAFGFQSDVYRYDVTHEDLECASCVDGTPGHQSFLAGAEKVTNNRIARSLDDQGRLFFTSFAALVPKDVNGEADVYVFNGGRTSLISPGTGPYRAQLMDISPDGTDVYFLTEQPLVAQDTNADPDVYDARIGGGFARQNEPPPVPCAGEGCQAAAPGANASPTIGSEVTSGSPPAKKKHRACGKGKHKVKGKCVKRKTHKKGAAKRHAKASRGGAR